ncbi:MAG: MFS transporter [Candidatus Marinimicrobia bacterium]|nr:MFS transporter [Candidatus Neomarinimicrobiota bacterium]
MPNFTHLLVRLKTNQFSHKLLYYCSLLIFFWALFDGIISFVTPLVITEKGLSKTTMGLIYSSSSIFGAIFDFLLSKFLKNTHWRRLFMITFAICFGYPFLLSQANSIYLFVFCMGIWGLYYDIQNFAMFDFLSRKSKPEEHSSSFGVISVFRSLGYLLAPILAGLLIGQLVGANPFWFAFGFLLISFVFYLLLFKSSKKEKSDPSELKSYKPINFLVEFHLWKKIGVILFPVLIFTMFLYIFDAFFWTIGPLYSQDFKQFSGFGGLFMTMYTLPTLLIGWVVGPITSKFGKKRTAFISFMISSVFLLTLFLWKNPFIILTVILISSIIGSIAWPAIKGAYVDYIAESFKYEREIEGLCDFFTNIGYIIGPVMAGFLSDKIGNSGAFSILGVGGIIISFILFFITPKSIQVRVKKEEIS